MSVGLAVKPTSLIWQSSLVIVFLFVVEGNSFEQVDDLLAVELRELTAPVVDLGLVHQRMMRRKIPKVVRVVPMLARASL